MGGFHSVEKKMNVEESHYSLPACRTGLCMVHPDISLRFHDVEAKAGGA